MVAIYLVAIYLVAKYPTRVPELGSTGGNGVTTFEPMSLSLYNV
jgi:hypothetical protein